MTVIKVLSNRLTLFEFKTWRRYRVPTAVLSIDLTTIWTHVQLTTARYDLEEFIAT